MGGQPRGGRLDALYLLGQDSRTIPCPRTVHRKATSCPTHSKVQMRVGERDFEWTFRSWQLEMVFRCITGLWNKPCDLGQTQANFPCNPKNHQQMPLLATRQESGILVCSVAELEPGAEVETLSGQRLTQCRWFTAGR